MAHNFASTSLDWHGLDCHVNITFQPSLPGLIGCLPSAHLIPSQCWSFPVNVFAMPLRYDVSVISYVVHYNNFMSQIYGMETPADTARAWTVWGSHVSMIKWGSLTLAQLFFPRTVLIRTHVLFSPGLQCPHSSDVCKVGHMPVPCQSSSLVLSEFTASLHGTWTKLWRVMVIFFFIVFFYA